MSSFWLLFFLLVKITELSNAQASSSRPPLTYVIVKGSVYCDKCWGVDSILLKHNLGGLQDVRIVVYCPGKKIFYGTTDEYGKYQVHITYPKPTKCRVTVLRTTLPSFCNVPTARRMPYRLRLKSKVGHHHVYEVRRFIFKPPRPSEACEQQVSVARNMAAPPALPPSNAPSTFDHYKYKL